MRRPQVCQERAGRDLVVGFLWCETIYQEVHYCDKRVTVNTLFATHFLHSLVPKTQSDAKGTQSLQHAVIVAD